MDDNATINLVIVKINISVFAISISSLGMMANLALMYIFLVDSFFRKITYNLMLISCLTDIISNITTIMSYIVMRNSGFKRSDVNALCRLFTYIIYTSYSISIMNLSLIALYRYISIVRPFSNLHPVYKKKFIIASEIFIWIACLGLGIPNMLYLQGEIYDIIFCDYSYINSSVSTYLIFFVVIQYVLPSTLIAISYWRIIVYQRNHVRPGQPSIQDKRQAIKRDKLVKSLSIISVCYILTTWPYFALVLGIAITQKKYIELLKENQTNYWLSWLSISTTALVAIINPFLCLKFDENIQRSFKIRFISKLLKSTRMEIRLDKK